jgi:hypothetical protein
MTARWLHVSAAPRDGTPVILWIEDPEAPPSYPVTIGAWTPDAEVRASYWRVFAVEYGATAYFDPHIRGWKPLPHPGDA